MGWYADVHFNWSCGHKDYMFWMKYTNCYAVDHLVRPLHTCERCAAFCNEVFQHIFLCNLGFFFKKMVVAYVPFHWGFHITSFTFQEFRHTCMWYANNFNGCFVCTPMLHLKSQREVHVWKLGFCQVLDLYWLWFGDSTHTYKKNAPTLASSFIKQLLLGLQYLHPIYYQL